MKVRELPEMAISELKMRYYIEKNGEDISYGELYDIDNIVSDAEVFEAYADTDFVEDDFCCLADYSKE